MRPDGAPAQRNELLINPGYGWTMQYADPHANESSTMLNGNDAPVIHIDQNYTLLKWNYKQTDIASIAGVHKTTICR